MKILGVSLGTKNGNNDTMCRVALEAAKEKGIPVYKMDFNEKSRNYKLKKCRII